MKLALKVAEVVWRCSERLDGDCHQNQSEAIACLCLQIRLDSSFFLVAHRTILLGGSFGKAKFSYRQS